ncbi:Glycyl-glycine endopeptidase ALE-1 precursor [Caloramator mitchellensis]|uniref:Glycyl-glycine endopeptidase ALE-1 n=1 Tax=Caloramator mitchellensis TaxID=908809 RepID=A0A0R3K461_CALMK|nr:M23 family metallopeptidase [Caloramator mitchellensis]KRQ87730.1 Glycyl-glycine endopeptidase ALE-1 precursor [Caloramator mitchellensis]
MGFKDNLRKTVQREMFYVVLFICLCVVAVAAVYFTRNNANIDKNLAKAPSQTEQKATEPNNEPTLVEEKNVGEAPVAQVPQSTVNKNDSNTSDKGQAKQDKATSKSDNAQPTIKMIMPVDGEVTKKFDKENLQYSATLQQWETHEGIDIACDIGTEVKAAADGKVVDVITDDKVIEGLNLKTGYGVTVIIEHNNGVQSIYGNLASDLKIKKGDRVKKGDIIGFVGDTSIREASSIEGSHLHFSLIKKHGKDVTTLNPLDFIK